jgi:hypothetical protein
MATLPVPPYKTKKELKKEKFFLRKKKEIFLEVPVQGAENTGGKKTPRGCFVPWAGPAAQGWADGGSVQGDTLLAA